jgi:hypothetical protein
MEFYLRKHDPVELARFSLGDHPSARAILAQQGLPPVVNLDESEVARCVAIIEGDARPDEDSDLDYEWDKFHKEMVVVFCGEDVGKSYENWDDWLQVTGGAFEEGWCFEARGKIFEITESNERGRSIVELLKGKDFLEACEFCGEWYEPDMVEILKKGAPKLRRLLAILASYEGLKSF